MRCFTLSVAVLGMVCLGNAASVRAGDENPILKAAMESISDWKKPFTMVVIVTVKEGQGKAFEELFTPALKATRKEPGCIGYDLNRDLKDATKYYVYERWRSIAALDAHFKTPHMKTLLGAVGDMLAGAPETKFYAVAAE